MLVLGRLVGQEILIGKDIRLQVVDIRGGLVRIGITAPRDVSIIRPDAVARNWEQGEAVPAKEPQR